MTVPDRPPVVRRTAHVLRPDPSRVVSTAFLPGEEIHGAGASRSVTVLERLLALSDADVATTLAGVLASFGSRHHDLTALLDSRFGLVARHVRDPERLSTERRQLIGACISQEYAIEAAAVFNPSMVAHPDQSGLTPGTTRFVMSVRGVGEGHISCIEFRTGTIDAADEIRFDQPGPTMAVPRVVPVEHSREAFQRQNAELDGDPSGAAAVLELLPPSFSDADLDAMVTHRNGQLGAPDGAVRTAARLAWIAACTYTIEFPAECPIDSRVILPGSPAESHGVEDLRLVGFAPTDGGGTYLGTYTAFDGASVAQHAVRTDDFTTFHVSRLSGSGAKNKGMALFPRPVHGQYVALSRWDRENNALATSSDLQRWDDAGTLRSPHHPWEILQAGNCGSPLETSAGWLVLTHGVGPMRQYGIGVMLLDLDDPRKVIAHLGEPLLTPLADERDGYVPNVVYSCGALLHGDTLVLPYGCSDASIRVALVDVPALLALLRPEHTLRAGATKPSTGRSPASLPMRL